MSSNSPNNPYGQAASTYGTHAQKHTPDQRELEARVLLKSANLIQDLQATWDSAGFDQIDEVLKYNRQIWLMFYDAALENTEGNRPNDLRSNIINLANFVFKRTIEILANPEKGKLDVLVSINREIAAGLMSGTSSSQGMAPSPSGVSHRPAGSGKTSITSA